LCGEFNNELGIKNAELRISATFRTKWNRNIVLD